MRMVRLLPAFLILSLVLPEHVHALCISTLPGCGGDLNAYLNTKLIPAIQAASVGILGAMLLFYAIRLAISGSDENTQTESKSAYLHAFFGMVLVGAAATLSSTISIGSSTPVDVSPIVTVMAQVANFFLAGVAVAILINIVYNGMKLITTPDENGSGEAKKGLIRGFVGVTMVLLAQAGMVAAVGTGAAGPFVAQVAGFGNFIITIFGVLAVCSIVIAGVFLVISVDEGLKDKAKKTIIAAAVALIVVMSASAIFAAFT